LRIIFVPSIIRLDKNGLGIAVDQEKNAII